MTHIEKKTVAKFRTQNLFVAIAIRSTNKTVHGSIKTLHIPLFLPCVRGVAAGAAHSVRVPHGACVHPVPRHRVLLHPGRRLAEGHPLQGPGLRSVSQLVSYSSRQAASQLVKQ